MTFEKWWATCPDADLDAAKDIARLAWDAALDEAASHFASYYYGPFENPALTIQRSKSKPQEEKP